MNVLVIGATGTIGKEIVNLGKSNGHKMVSASRKSEAAINIEDGASLKNYFNHAPAFDAIICAAGTASFGKFSDLNADQIKVGINSKLMGQLNLVKEGLQKLKPGGSILLTGGMLAYAPWPETSNIAMVNAGLEGFVKAVALEKEDNKKVGIVHPPLVKETAEAMGLDGSPWPSASTVAETYLNALTKESNEVVHFVNGYEPS